MNKTQSGTLRALLLHKLPPAQTEQLEDRVLQDEALANQLEVETTDLFDDYALGLLNSEEVKLFEEHLLIAPDAPQRLSFAKGLAAVRQANKSQIPSRPLPAGRVSRLGPLPVFTMALAACVLILVLALIHFRRGPNVTPNSTNPSAETVRSNGPKQSSSPSPSNADDSNSTYTLVLVPNQVRGEATRTFVVPSGTTALRIQCEVPIKDSSQEFRMVLKTAAGDSHESKASLGSTQASEIYYVQASYPAAGLKPGHYTISVHSVVQGSRSIASYNFLLQFAQK
jgi:hypothetical protein